MAECAASKIVRLPEDIELLRRAVQNAVSRRYVIAHPRFEAVMDLFALGPISALALCRQVGLDPNEMVRR